MYQLKIFVLLEDVETQTCGLAHLTAKNSLQYISTPNWPDYYPANLSCTWFINSQSNKYLQLHFLGILTEKHVDELNVS